MRTAIITRALSSRPIRGLLALMGGAALALGLQQGTASATPAGPGAKPPGPSVGQYDRRAAPMLTEPVSAWQLTKELRARQYYTSLTRASVATGESAATSTSSLNLAVGYQKQYYEENYCGPATFAMVSSYLHVGWSGSTLTQQNAAASLLGTTSDGTPWYGSDNVPIFPYASYYPMADAMNYRLWLIKHTHWYNPAAVSSTPTSSQSTAYKENLTFDIKFGYPMMIAQDSIPGYQFHWQPRDYWQHWLVVRGYSSSGSYSVINDPGFTTGNDASAPSTGGAGSVIQAIGGRGYIW